MAAFENGYALVVGIANYAHVRKLPDSVLADANSINELLQDVENCGYPADQVKLLTNDQATAVNIKKELSWLAENTEEADTAVIYFSGHGGQIKTGEHTDNYLIPYEASATNLPGTAISDTELVSLLNKIRAGRLLVMFDCCHAGGIGDVKGIKSIHEGTVKSGLDSKLYERLGQGIGRAVIASSRSDEVSWVMSDMPNSLFTYHLLDAFKGKAPMRGDGLVRLFDLFDYVSEHVSEDQPNQHPILKAEIEKNFPIALHLGGQKSTPKQLSPKVYKKKPAIENYMGVKLSSSDEDILHRMYDGYKRIVIKGELGGGYGGGRVFIIHPVIDRSAELPVVVKTGPINIIEEEWSAFKQFVEYKVPQVAEILGDLIYSTDRRWGGIRYPLAGNELYKTTSFKSFCQQFDLNDVVYVLEDQLFNTMKEMWRKNSNLDVAFVGGSFDPILPVNMKLRLLPDIPTTDTLTPDNCFQSSFNVGSLIAVSGFEIIEVDEKASEITLNLPHTDYYLPKSYRIRFTDVSDMKGFGEGKIISKPLIGVLQKTRASLVQESVKSIFKNEFDTSATNILIPEIGSVLNPLPEIPNLLRKSRHVRVGPIHGDLNLENILVVYDKRNRHVFLIDFANAREDIVLHDLWRLETAIWLYPVANILKETGRPLSDIPNLVESLHFSFLGFNHPDISKDLETPIQIITAIRQQAKDYMIQSKDWSEYYDGLILHLIGALKFKTLDNEPSAPLPKQVAFLTAASLLQITQDPPDPTKSVDSTTTPNTDSKYPLTSTIQSDPPPPIKLTTDPLELSVILNEHFSVNDIRKLCFQMKIDPEEIPGQTRSAKVQEFVVYLKRRGRLPELPDLIRKARPSIDWQ